MKTPQEQIRESLSDFWKNLTNELQIRIGQEVAFLIGMHGKSTGIMTITRDTISKLGIHSIYFDQAISLFNSLEESEKGKVTEQLSTYFLSRNSIPTI